MSQEWFFLRRPLVTPAQLRLVAGWREGPSEHWGIDLSGRLQLSAFKRDDDPPVQTVNWIEAMGFCARLSQKTGKIHHALRGAAGIILPGGNHHALSFQGQHHEEGSKLWRL